MQLDDAPDAPKFMVARCRSPRGAVNEINVLDITIAGCLIEHFAMSIKPEQRVLIKLAGLTYLPATVLWVEEDRASLAFERPLYSPVLTHLLRAFKRGGPDMAA